MISSDIGVWVAGLLTLGILSILYGDSALSRLFAHIFIGSAAGYYMIQAINSLWKSGIIPLLSGNFIFIIPLVLGLSLFSRLIRGYAWVSRYGLALLTGVGTGLLFFTAIDAQLIQQILSVIAPVKGNFYDVLVSIIRVIFFIFPIFYFIFTIKPEKTMNKLIHAGKYAMMIGFGASYGALALSRLTLIINVLSFILKDWFGLGLATLIHALTYY